MASRKTGGVKPLARKPKPTNSQELEYSAAVLQALKRYPDLYKRLRDLEGCKDSVEFSRGFNSLLLDLFARACADGSPLPDAVCRLALLGVAEDNWRSACQEMIDMLGRRTQRGSEWCRVLDKSVLVLQECSNPAVGMPEHARQFFVLIWRYFSLLAAKALAPECESRGMDSTPLLKLRDSPSLPNALEANALVARLCIKLESEATDDVMRRAVAGKRRVWRLNGLRIRRKAAADELRMLAETVEATSTLEGDTLKPHHAGAWKDAADRAMQAADSAWSAFGVEYRHPTERGKRCTAMLPDDAVDRDAKQVHLSAHRATMQVWRGGPLPSDTPARLRKLAGLLASEGVRGGDDKHKTARPPVPEIVVVTGQAPLTPAEIRLMRTRTAYMESSGNVQSAWKRLNQSGHPIGVSTFYEHLDKLDARDDPEWQKFRRNSGQPGKMTEPEILANTGMHRNRRGNARRR